MKKATSIERFEAVGDLYYARHHRLRPGKSESPATYRDANDDENRAQFENWLAMNAFSDAIDRIVELERKLADQPTGDV